MLGFSIVLSADGMESCVSMHRNHGFSFPPKALSSQHHWNKIGSCHPTCHLGPKIQDSMQQYFERVLVRFERQKTVEIGVTKSSAISSSVPFLKRSFRVKSHFLVDSVQWCFITIDLKQILVSGLTSPFPMISWDWKRQVIFPWNCWTGQSPPSPSRSDWRKFSKSGSWDDPLCSPARWMILWMFNMFFKGSCG